MRIISTSQISGEREIAVAPGSDGRLHKAIMKALDDMSETAKLIQNLRTPNILGNPGNQPISNSSVRMASLGSGSLFFEEDDASSSFWVITRLGERVRISLGELFPSGEYDIRQVRSDEFGGALEARMSKKSLDEAKRDLLATNENQVAAMESVTLVGEISKDVRDRTVCDWIPLNDFEKNLSDLFRTFTIDATGGE